MIKVLITGPECSGKSYLTKKLVDHFGGLIVEEYARIYLEGKKGYEFSDLLEIAKGQLKSEKLEGNSNPAFLFCDTGVEVIKIWSEVKFGKVNPDILDMINYSTYDVILLCKPNIPYESDKLRESPNTRQMLFELYINELESSLVEFDVIDSAISNRVAQAISIVNDFMR